MATRLGFLGELRAKYPAGTANLDMQKLLNVAAGTTNKESLAALNQLAGTTGKEMAHVCRILGLPEGP